MYSKASAMPAAVVGTEETSGTLLADCDLTSDVASALIIAEYVGAMLGGMDAVLALALLALAAPRLVALLILTLGDVRGPASIRQAGGIRLSSVP